MNYKYLALSVLVASTLAACADQPLIMWHDDKSRNAGSETTQAEAAAPSRPALDVPPELRGTASVPMPDAVAVSDASQDSPASQVVMQDVSAVAGTAVSLDARVYDQDVAQLFSSVIDAMTALNLPVESVDSPSGTITSDWVREGVNNPNMNVGSAVSGLFGDGTQAARYRYVVRVLRHQLQNGGEKSKLEIRTIGQVYVNRHWVNKPIKRKVSDDLFSATEERLARQ